MEIPDAVKEMVTVTYASEDENVAGYENGTVTANAVGKTIVTATVTAKDEVLGYGGFSMNLFNSSRSNRRESTGTCS